MTIASARPMPDSGPAFPRAGWYPALYVLLWLVVIGGLWLLPALPTQDGPSHLYFLGVLSDLLAGRGPWSSYYAADLQLRPYLGFVAIGLPLTHLLSLDAIERVFVSLYALALACSLPALLRAVGRPAFPLSFLTLPLAVNYGLCLGFYTYSLACALFLLALAWLWRERDQRLHRRAAILTVASLGIWTIHLVPAAFLLLAAALLEVTRPHPPEAPSAARRGLGARAASAVLVPLPATLAILLLTLPHIGAGPLVVPAWHAPIVLAFLALTFGTVVLGPGQLAPALALLLWLAITLPWRALPRHHVSRWLGSLGGLLALAVLVAPNFALAGGYFNERTGWLVPLVLAPLLRPPRGRWLAPLRRAHGPFLAALAVVAMAITWHYVVPEARTLVAFRRGLDARLEAGATVVLARYTPRPVWPLYDPLRHAAGIYGRVGLVDLGYSDEAGVRYFPVRLLPTARLQAPGDRAYYTPREVDWSWGANAVDYLLAWGATAADATSLQHRFTRVWAEEGNPLSIWRRR